MFLDCQIGNLIRDYFILIHKDIDSAEVGAIIIVEIE